MSLPQPRRPLIVCSLAAILLCTVLCALCTATLLRPWGIRGLGGLLLLPGFLGLGLTQYAGTFQGKAARAETVARLYGFMGGFMLIVLVCVLFDIARSGKQPPWPVLALGAGLVIASVWGRIGSRLNREWAEELYRFEGEQEGEQEGEDPTAVRRGPRAVWVSTFVAFVAITGAFYWAMGPRQGEHVEAPATPFILPPEASDVSYYMYTGNTLFEFTVPEKTFLAWAEGRIQQQQSEFEGMKPVEEPVTIPTCRSEQPDAPPPHEIVVGEGYYHEWQEGGQRVRYAYDCSTGRAYYASTREVTGKGR